MENFRWILLILIVTILIMQTKIWISEDGYFQLRALQNDLEIQRNENIFLEKRNNELEACLLYTSPSPRDGLLSRMPSSA